MAFFLPVLGGLALLSLLTGDSSSNPKYDSTPKFVKDKIAELDRNKYKSTALPEADALSSFRQGERDFTNRNSISSAYSNNFPTITDILSRLDTLQNPSRYLMDPASLSAQARAGVNAQYDPIISQLRQQMQATQTRGNQNKERLGQMYSALSSSLQSDIPAVEQTFANTKQNTQGEYNQLKSNIQGQYAQSQADQEALYRRLNIEAAAPDAMKNQFRDKEYFTNLADKEAQTQQAAIDTEGRGAVEYTRRGSELAQTEGTNRQADLMEQLRQMMEAYQGQIGANETAKEQAYQSSLLGLQQQAQQQAVEYSQRDFDNYLKAIGLGRELRQDELKLQNPVTVVKSPADVASRALGLGLPQSSAQNLQNAFMTAVGTDPVILSGMNSGTGMALPKEALAARVVEAGRNAGLSAAELNALHTMALEYFGRA